MVSRSVAAGKRWSTRIDRSRTTDGCRGSGVAVMSSPSATCGAAASRSSSATNTGSLAGRPRASASAGCDCASDAERHAGATVRDRTASAVRPGTAHGRVGRDEAQRRQAEAERHGLDGGLHVEEVGCAAAPAPVLETRGAHPREADAARLAAVDRETRAGLVQLDVASLAAPIVAERVHQAGQQRRAQHRELLGQRVRDHDQLLVDGRTGPPPSARRT